jgi:hypothetical protein
VQQEAMARVKKFIDLIGSGTHDLPACRVGIMKVTTFLNFKRRSFK